ncbi:hypothetical protein H2199_006096 [Coniosporium tulheliwenetii]|uniref:Uncharacterized protein n=1 Tax=Coniosporium tulheliwenetii TaxID=3383036 RepID=A0ACC2YX75_9PEZI|nr:hypothetical protein H2199_006096 [Cladosporium sp. JES 115]
MPAQAGTRKTMSSRLLTMKFMQRAAATPTSPQTPTGPPNKRRRLSSTTTTPPAAEPARPATDLEALQAVLAAEEEKRVQAIERLAAEAGDTRWVLSFREPDADAAGQGGLTVVNAGFAAIDDAGSYDEERDERPTVGRRSFGKPIKSQQMQNGATPASTSDAESSSSASDDDGDPGDLDSVIRSARKGAAAEVRAQRKSKKAAKEAESARLAYQRRTKAVGLNGTSSISSGGGRNAGGGGSNICAAKKRYSSD